MPFFYIYKQMIQEVDFVIDRNYKFDPNKKMEYDNFDVHWSSSKNITVGIHHHDFFEVYIFIRGAGEHIIENTTYYLESGDILIIAPSELHQMGNTAGYDEYERMALWINPEYLEKFSTGMEPLARCFDKNREEHASCLRGDPAQQQSIVSLLERILIERTNKEYGHEQAVEMLFTCLLTLLNRIALKNFMEEDEYSQQDIANRVVTYINEHYKEDLTLDMLAEFFSVSKYHMSHAFQKNRGISVYKYIIRKRLQVAKHMLIDGIPATEAYHLCGFGDYANFYRAFRTTYGVTPKEYIKSIKRDGK